MSENHPTPLSSIVSQYEHNLKSKFRPTTDFYRPIGISRIQFSKLIKGTTTITGPEARAFSPFFKVDISELI